MQLNKFTLTNCDIFFVIIAFIAGRTEGTSHFLAILLDNCSGNSHAGGCLTKAVVHVLSPVETICLVVSVAVALFQ